MDERYSRCFQTASDYHGRSNSHIPQPTGIGCCSQPRRFAKELSSIEHGYAGEEQGRQHQHLQGCQHGLSFHPHSHPHPHSLSHPLAFAQPHDLHESIYREMEKERIRQDIIMSEILRRRALEAEVRREMTMMMERELALGGSNTFPFGSPSPVGLDLPMRLPLVETRSREERFVLSLSQMNNLNYRRESDRSVPLPFESASDDAREARNLEVKPILEGVRENQNIILQAKPIENATGAKRARSGSDDCVSKSDGKKAKKKTNCTLCQVSVTSEESLNDHLKGKRHKAKEAELRAQKTGKSYSIGLTTKKAAKPTQGSGPVDPGMQSETKFTPEPPSQENLTSDKLKKEESLVPEQVQTKDNPEKKNIRIWCEICQICVSSEQVMDSHKTGKKHRRQLDQMNKSSGVGPSQKNAAVVKTMAEYAGDTKPVEELLHQ